MTGYPNREHQNKDQAARKNALHILGNIRAEVSIIEDRLKGRSPIHMEGLDVQVLASSVRDLTIALTTLETLREVRQWHEADEQEKQGEWQPGDTIAAATGLLGKEGQE